MSDRKVLFDTSTAIQNAVYINNNYNSGYTEQALSYGVADAGRHRIKAPPPLCMSATMMVLTIHRDQTNTYERISGTVGSFWFTYRGSPTFVFETDPVQTKSHDSSDGTQELLRARAKVSDYNFGETLVEMNQTLGMIASRLNSFVSFVRDVKAGRWNKLNHKPSKKLRNTPASKRMAQGYLELQFGWKPLLQDIHDGLEAMSSGLRTRGSKVRTRSGLRVPRKFTTGLDSWVDGQTLEANATYTGVVRNERLAQLNQLGLANPALMAWNKLPFSFLVDWFIPISTVLGALTAGAGLECRFGCVTTRSVLDRFQVVKGQVIMNGQDYTAVRKPVIPPNMPPLGLKGASPSIGKVITGAALARSVLMR